ncbi:PBIP1 protein, partial [Chordeiles acutipennis]|nr:PBIP1 protein [Chordeiles acutipennis]
PPCPSPGSPAEEGSCTSSDDDAEGLRRRQGHEPRPGPPRPTTAPHRGTPDTGAGDGLSVSKCLLGALALVAVGLLIVSGPMESVVSRDVAMGEQESPLPADANVRGGGPQWGSAPPRAGQAPQDPTLPLGQDSQQNPPPPAPHSVESMSLLLDKLAKENQEIRLLQAELQAHREELQRLLQRSEGQAAAAGEQQQNLAAENTRLRAALERETAALRDARAEVQRLRGTGTPGSAGEPGTEPPPEAGASSHGEDVAWRRGARQHGWLESVRRELAG